MLIFNYHIMYLTDYSYVPKIRMMVGDSLIIFTLIFFGFNLGIVILEMLQTQILQIRRLYL